MGRIARTVCAALAYDTAHPLARPWLYGIASNLVARHHRAELRRYKALTRVGLDHTVDGHAGRVVTRSWSRLTAHAGVRMVWGTPSSRRPDRPFGSMRVR
jgi:hypothetical protein